MRMGGARGRINIAVRRKKNLDFGEGTPLEKKKSAARGDSKKSENRNVAEREVEQGKVVIKLSLMAIHRKEASCLFE